MDRERLEFRHFINAGPDKVTGIWYVPEASDEYFAQVEEDTRNDIDDLV